MTDEGGSRTDDRGLSSGRHDDPLTRSTYDDPLTTPRRSRSARKAPGGEDSRQRRLAGERARRRRRNRQRVAIFAALVVLAAGAYFGVSRVGWMGDGQVDGGATGEDKGPTEVVLIRVLDEGETRVAAVVSADPEPSILFGLPGDVLIRAQSGFAPLYSFLDAPEDQDIDLESALEGIEAIVGVRPTAIAEVEWSDLREAALKTEAGAGAPETLEFGDAISAAAVADAFKAVLGAEGDATVDVSLDDLSFRGDHDAARTALSALPPGPAVSGALPGRPIEGIGFAYYEPDVTATKAMLGGKSPESAVSVEVQNGSGAVGAAQKISDLIAPLGYTLLPPKNAEGFPDVATTQLFAAPDAVGQADRLRGILGLGTVVEQDSLPPGMVVIVVGQDLDVDSLPNGSGDDGSS
jgi:hypothetical protein